MLDNRYKKVKVASSNSSIAPSMAVLSINLSKPSGSGVYALVLNAKVTSQIKHKNLHSYDIYEDSLTSDLLLVFSNEGSMTLSDKEYEKHSSFRLVNRGMVQYLLNRFNLKEAQRGENLRYNLTITEDQARTPEYATFKLSYHE